MHKIQKEILTTVVFPCPRQKLYIATRNVEHVAIDTDPEACYYTSKAFRSQNVSFRPQSVPFRSQSVSFRPKRSNRFVQSVPSKAFGSLREFSLSLSKWRIDNEVESSAIYLENTYFI